MYYKEFLELDNVYTHSGAVVSTQVPPDPWASLVTTPVARSEGFQYLGHDLVTLGIEPATVSWVI